MRQFAATLSMLGLTGIFVACPVHAETIAITNATVHTIGPQGTIQNATIIIVDGEFESVGAALEAPDGAQVIDASGKIITPGLFTPTGYLGLVEVGLSAGPLDAVQRGERFTAGFDVADAYNSRSTLIAANRIEGVTRALIVPRATTADEQGNKSHVISGMAATINLGQGTDTVDRRAAAMVVNLGEGGSELAGESRAAALLMLREALDEAGDYQAHRDDFERGQHRDYTYSITDLEALQAVLDGSTPIMANVDRASDIEVLIRLCGEYALRCIVSGGAEAWLLAEQLAAAAIAVILAPTANLPASFDHLNASLTTAAVLESVGVTISFADDRGHTHNAGNITQSAGNAVAEGLPYQAALRAITLAPALMFGVADRVGSIEPGKAADLVIWPDDPLELRSYPEQVIINGEIVAMTSRQTLLRDRYLKEDSSRPPAFRR